MMFETVKFIILTRLHTWRSAWNRMHDEVLIFLVPVQRSLTALRRPLPHRFALVGGVRPSEGLMMNDDE
ncbi:hypothetical protein ABZ383_14480 [Streptomyces sp. NPDC005900]|uniref:hypothetical protein n=1 Tax=Streptomyces sp. NPDC005900 TaxID=3154569 RepID=UPI0033EA2181